MSFYKYTPALSEPSLLVDGLVGREDILNAYAKALQSAESERGFPHSILIGAKGMGKSHILRVVYNVMTGESRLNKDGYPDLSNFVESFFVVILPEEAYTTRLEMFLLTILRSVVESDPQHQTSPAPPKRILEANAMGEEERIALLEYFRSFKEESGRVLLVLVDNFHDILDGFSHVDQGELRNLLMTGRSTLFFCAAPTLFHEIVNHDYPFYNFFEILWLPGITFEQTKEMLKQRAIHDGFNELVDEIDSKSSRINAVHALTGGTPRLLLALYHIMTEDELISIEEAFLQAVDDLTPYFRERMRDLAPQQREILDVLAQSDESMSPTELAKSVRLPVATVNSQLKRLEEGGVVKKYAHPGRKSVDYTVSEVLFSIWRQMRVEAGKKKVRFIVKLLALWFEQDEIEERLEILNRTEIESEKGWDTQCVQHQLDYYHEALKICQERGSSFIFTDCEESKVIKILTEGKIHLEKFLQHLKLEEFELAVAQGEASLNFFRSAKLPPKFGMEPAFLMPQLAWTYFFADRPVESLDMAVWATRELFDFLDNEEKIEAYVDVSHDSLGNMATLADALQILGFLYAELDKDEDAIEVVKKLITIQKKIFENNSEELSLELARSTRMLAEMYKRAELYDDAFYFSEQSLAHNEGRKGHSENGVLHVGILLNLAQHYFDDGNHEDAFIFIGDALLLADELATKNFEEFGTAAALCFMRLTTMQVNLEYIDEALGSALHALRLSEKLAERGAYDFKEGLQTSLQLCLLVAVLAEAYELALGIAAQLRDILMGKFSEFENESNSELTKLFVDVVKIYARMGELEKSTEMIMQAIEDMSDVEKSIPLLIPASVILYELLLLENRKEEGFNWLEKIISKCEIGLESTGLTGALIRGLARLELGNLVLTSEYLKAREESSDCNWANPFIGAVEYLSTGDGSRIDKLHPTERVFADEIVREIASKKI